MTKVGRSNGGALTGRGHTSLAHSHPVERIERPRDAPRSSPMCVPLLVVGAIFETAGLLLVAFEIAMIEKRELGSQPLPVRLATRAINRLRRVLGLPGSTTITLGAAVESNTALSARAKVRVGPVPDGASVEDRIARLERYVEQVDADLDDDRKAAEHHAREAERRAGERIETVEQELQRWRNDRESSLRDAVQLQWVGTLVFVLGVWLTFIGGIA